MAGYQFTIVEMWPVAKPGIFHGGVGLASGINEKRITHFFRNWHGLTRKKMKTNKKNTRTKIKN